MVGPKCSPQQASNRAMRFELTRSAKVHALRSVFAHSSVRYLLVGFSNTAVGFAVIWVALRCFGLGNITANAVGYTIAFVWSFSLNRRWTFDHNGALGPALLRYLLMMGVAYGMNLLVVMLAERRLTPGSLFVQIDGMLTYTVVAYAGARYFVFRTNRAVAWRLAEKLKS
jgi:putative flippase GtrA